MLVAQRWILARLRNRTFFSLDDLNAAIAELLEDLNTRPFRREQPTSTRRGLAVRASASGALDKNGGYRYDVLRYDPVARRLDGRSPVIRF